MLKNLLYRIPQKTARPSLMGSFLSRTMILHEYHAAQVVLGYRVGIPLGHVAYNAKEAFAVARKFGSDYDRKFVVKAQVQATGRTRGHFL